MLYSPDSGQCVTKLPHPKVYSLYRSRLSSAEFDAITDELNQRIDDNDIHTSSWIPGSDWTNTVFQPIYERACRHNETEAAKFFGLILFEVMMNHPKLWGFGHYEMDGKPIEGMTYFRYTSAPPCVSPSGCPQNLNCPY